MILCHRIGYIIVYRFLWLIFLINCCYVCFDDTHLYIIFIGYFIFAVVIKILSKITLSLLKMSEIMRKIVP